MLRINTVTPMVLAILVQGCGTPPVVPTVDLTTAARILVFPTIDSRARSMSKPVEVPRGDCQQNSAGRERVWSNTLAWRNAVAIIPSGMAATHDFVLEDFETGNSEKLKLARRGEEDYALFLFMRTFQVKSGRVAFGAEVFVINVGDGSVVWKNAIEGESPPLSITGLFHVSGPEACEAYGMMAGTAMRPMPRLDRRQDHLNKTQ